MALAQLAAWGNLESQPDMARVATPSDYYRARDARARAGVLVNELAYRRCA